MLSEKSKATRKSGNDAKGAIFSRKCFIFAPSLENLYQKPMQGLRIEEAALTDWQRRISGYDLAGFAMNGKIQLELAEMLHDTISEVTHGL